MTQGPENDASFAVLNDSFHATYDLARVDEDVAAPVLVVLSDALVLFRRDRRSDRSFRSPAFHVLKSAAHAPVAVFAALVGTTELPLPRATRSKLEALHDLVRATNGGPPQLTDVALADLRAALNASAAFADRVLAEGRVTQGALETFAAEVGTVLLRLTEHATRVQLNSLHAAVEAELSTLTQQERRTMQVIVAGDHQARARSLAVQYFQKRFREAPGAEVRVTYAEGIVDAAQALALAGKRRLDRQIASAFFADPRKLQRDVLGDAAGELLGITDLDPID